MLTRRQIDCGFAASFSLGGLRIATTLTWAQASFQNDPLPKLQSGGDGPDAGLKIYAGALTGKLLTDGDSLPAQSNGLSPQGVGEPKSEEKTLGRKIVTEAPIRCRPFDVAEYFRPQNLVNKFGKAAEEYARGWPADRPFNPLIFEFLARMRYVESDMRTKGDKTDWCAAFVSWCLLRSRVSSREEILPKELINQFRHPGARAFLCFGQETKQPKLGDIVVWYDLAEIYDCHTPAKAVPESGLGHVAFYIGPSTTLFKGKVVDAVTVLGGNQGFEGLENNQWVCVKSVPKEYDGKKLTAYRTHSMLHAAPDAGDGCTQAMKDRREC